MTPDFSRSRNENDAPPVCRARFSSSDRPDPAAYTGYTETPFFRANRTTQDIGARRLMTILEKCLEDLSFEASERRGQKIVVDGKLVEQRLGDAGDDADLIPYRL